MYNLIKTIKSVCKNYNPEAGAEALAMGGILVGSLAGVVLPLYVGWEIGEYVKDALEFGAVVGTATKVVGAIGLTSLIGSVTVPIGAFGGMVTGEAIGTAIGKAKGSLEKLVSKK